jgi:ribosome recycling factor
MINVKLEENNPKPFKSAMEEEMTKSLKHFEGELIKIRTGRAHTSLIEDIKVAVYGETPSPLKQHAALAAPEPRLITIQPWDGRIIPDIEKAILTSDVGLTPVNDGKVIRLQLPEMSHARREELVKVLNKKLEECRVAMRNVRKEFNNLIRDAKKDKKISENFFNRLTDLLQEVTDKFIGTAEEKAAVKQKEVTTL